MGAENTISLLALSSRSVIGPPTQGRMVPLATDNQSLQSPRQRQRSPLTLRQWQQD